MKNELLLQRAKALKLHGLISHWEEVINTNWLEPLIEWEETERVNKSLERRIQSAKMKRFKPLSNFDWDWPKKCDRMAIEELMQLGFLKDTTNVIFCGPNGVGKTDIACNIGNQAILQGHTVLFTTAGKMLNDLASQDEDNALRRRFKYYASPNLLIVDEVGFLSYSSRHADLLFEIVSQRYQNKSTIITTNKPFSEWGDSFPNASCVVALIDRLIHKSEIISIEGDSYRYKEAMEEAERRKTRRKNKNSK